MKTAQWAFAIAVLSSASLLPAQAAERRIAVFDFELIDTSLDGALKGPRADEQERIGQISTNLRQQLSSEDKVSLVDIGPVDQDAHAVHLQACGACDADFAAKVGADLSITGTVQKVSNLILNMSIYVRDVASRQVVAAMNADMRGNTDESWSRTLDWMVRNRLRPALEGLRL
jgi:hypothetical protein